MNATWTKRFVDIAQLVASWSKQPDIKTGCVIVNDDKAILSTGYNGLPRGVDYLPDRLVRPDRTLWFEHAERNAIFNAACHGIALRGTTLILPWYPCSGCMRAIIQSGIVRLVCQPPSLPEGANPKWAHDFEIAQQMALEAGLEVEYYEEPATAVA